MADRAKKPVAPKTADAPPAAHAAPAAVETATTTTAAVDPAHDVTAPGPALEPIVEPMMNEPPLASLDLGPSPAAMAGIALPELGGSAATVAGKHFGLLLDVGVEVAAVVGSRELKLEQVLAIQPGSIIDLDKHAGEPIELYVNGKPIALAEIVVIDGRLGARVVETLSAPASPAS